MGGYVSVIKMSIMLENQVANEFNQIAEELGEKKVLILIIRIVLCREVYSR